MNSDQSSDKQPRTISNESSLAALPLRVSETKLADAMDEDKADFETPAIEFRNVDFSYDDNKVLNGVNFQVARGEIPRSFCLMSRRSRLTLPHPVRFVT
jgi:ABC-type multidrug transport system fused ATPase/permease subunit